MIDRPLNIGCDIDGVLASFENGYADLLTAQTGITFPKGDPNFPAKWHWTGDFGVTKAQDAAAWDAVKRSDNFWLALEPMPWALTTLTELRYRRAVGDNIYFITNRMGRMAKRQTEDWLRAYGYPDSTVCLCEKKGPLAVGLDLDIFIDDKPSNCEDVLNARWNEDQERSRTKVYLVDRPYNRQLPENFSDFARGVVRVPRALDVLLELSQETQRVAA